MKIQSHPHLFFLFILCSLLSNSFETYSQNGIDFPVVSAAKKTILCIDKNEPAVVQKAAGMFSRDVSEITGKALSIGNTLPEKGTAIIAGTLGQSMLIKKIIHQYKIPADSIRSVREAFSLRIIERKQGNILLITGSDRRGTAYGLLELSRMMGISPWIWWADVKPVQRKELFIHLNEPVVQKPSVQYRGIFLNDEDWGLKPWASKALDPETGEIGPKTYGKIFELLLRLRANTIWPAMHECTTPFYFVKGNAAMADSFGIIISTSHCEPLMRSNPQEWNTKIRGNYNFFTNKDHVIDYWNERLTEVSNYENIYTVGMRGIHDGAMEGAKTVSQQVDGLTDVFRAQRDLLSKSLHKGIEDIPQIFIPYKEVLDAYNAGLKVPDDISLVWCDDNYGYLTRLSNPAERQRKGGSGVYYHLSYWGRPHDYLWLATTQPAMVWEEMQQAWNYDARKMWIVNAGDIKPAEYLTGFFLDMAWDINSIKHNAISQHLEDWSGQTFGKEYAVPIRKIMNEYYRLAFIRRPEFMGWSQTEPTTKVKLSDLNFTEFGDEIAGRLRQYNRLERQVDSLAEQIPASLKNAYFELIQYPVYGAAEMNKKWLNKQYGTLFAPYQLKETSLVNRKSLQAWEKIQQLTAYYNDSLENGKWKLIMSSQPRKLPVFDRPALTETDQPSGEIIFWPEESEKPMSKGDTVKLVLDNCSKGIYYFNTDSFSIATKPDWLSVERIRTKDDDALPANKLILKVLPSKIKEKTIDGWMTLSSKGSSYYFFIKGISDPESHQEDRCIRLKASGFTTNTAKEFASWQSVEGLGYSGSAMILQPFNAKLSSEILRNPSLEYDFSIAKADSAYLRIYVLPTHPLNNQDFLQIAVSIDESPLKLIDFKTEGRSRAWRENVLRNQSVINIPWKFDSKGIHKLRIFPVDQNVVIDQLMIDFKTNRRFYLNESN